ncbi:MAG: hypothetical protein ACAI44_09610 [Candidatus Sericytochromatia bacterium]
MDASATLQMDLKSGFQTQFQGQPVTFEAARLSVQMQGETDEVTDVLLTVRISAAEAAQLAGRYPPLASSLTPYTPYHRFMMLREHLPVYQAAIAAADSSFKFFSGGALELENYMYTSPVPGFD